MADLKKKQSCVGDGMLQLVMLVLWKRLLLMVIDVWMEGCMWLIGLDGIDCGRMQEWMMKFNRLGWEWRKRSQIVVRRLIGRLGAKLISNSLEPSGTLRLVCR